jgi:hypothetical protein
MYMRSSGESLRDRESVCTHFVAITGTWHMKCVTAMPVPPLFVLVIFPLGFATHFLQHTATKVPKIEGEACGSGAA